MNRYSFRYVKGQHYCLSCSSMTGVGIETDKQTGSDYFVCEKHRNTGSMRRNKAHPDFRKVGINSKPSVDSESQFYEGKNRQTTLFSDKTTESLILEGKQ